MRKLPLPHSIQGDELVIQQALTLIPEHSSYVELFLSSNSIFLSKLKVVDNWLNDIDADFILALSYIRDCPNEFIAELEVITPVTQDKDTLGWYLYRGGDFESAVVWFYENMIASSQAENANPLQWPQYIRELSESLKGVLLTCYPYERVLWALPKGSLVYIDPDADFKAGNHTKDEYIEKHRVLSATLQENSFRLSFILKCENLAELKALYAWVDNQEEKKHHGSVECEEMLFIYG